MNKKAEGKRPHCGKLALLYVMKFLLENTDENHAVTTPDIERYLDTVGIVMDRRTIRNNIDALSEFGLDIIKVNDRGHGGCFVGKREFEMPELKLLVDAVQTSKFITEKKSRELVDKLSKLTSEHRAKQLNREVFIKNRVKTGNQSIFYNVDCICEAMDKDKQLEFQYGILTVQKKLKPKKDGEIYKVSPYRLTWDDENYYLIALDSKERVIKHFRVDKMIHPRMSEITREGSKTYKNLDIVRFSKKTFGMYGGADKKVKLRCENRLAGVIIDRFGSDVMIMPCDDEHFETKAEISVSRQFFGWLCGVGEGIEIVSPDEVRVEYCNYLKNLLESVGG